MENASINSLDNCVQREPFYRVLSTEECEKRIRILNDHEYSDIILRPKEYGSLTGVSNIPYRFKDAWYFTWGYLGNGPIDTSQNILYHFSGGDYNFACDFTFEFMQDVVAKLPGDNGVVLSSAFVLEWISARRGKKSIFHRYRHGVDCSPHRSWDFGSFNAISKQKYID